MTKIPYRPIPNMDTDDVYFDKDELLLLGDDSMCQYSGLPSVNSYITKEDEEVIIGHA